jgi:hypothetical protein
MDRKVKRLLIPITSALCCTLVLRRYPADRYASLLTSYDLFQTIKVRNNMKEPSRY